MRKNWLITFLLFIFLSLNNYGQSIKQRVGTSLWLKNNLVFADSTISTIINYDYNGIILNEWYLFRDSLGHIEDTLYIELDSLERIIYGRSFLKKEITLTEYHDRFVKKKSIYFRAKDTIINEYLPIYGTNGKIIKSIHKYNGQFINDTVYYSYQDNTFTEDNAWYTKTEIYNDKGQIIRAETKIKIPPQSTEIKTYDRDQDYNIISFKHQIDGKLVKKTTHYYSNGIEQHMNEEFFDPNYVIKTSFKYLYWSK